MATTVINISTNSDVELPHTNSVSTPQRCFCLHRMIVDKEKHRQRERTHMYGLSGMHIFKRPKLITLLSVVLSLATASVAASDGTEIGTLAESMNPGEWAEFSTNNVDVLAAPGAGSSHSIQEYATGGAWDAANKVLYYIGSSDPHTADLDGKFVTYSAATNSWEVRPDPSWYPSPGGVSHSYDHHAFDPTRGTFYYHPFGINEGGVHAFDVNSQSWSQAPNISSPSGSGWVVCCSGLEYFPERDSLIWNNLVGGGDGKSEILEWKIGSAGWTVLDTSAGMGNHHGFTNYNSVHGAIWMGGGIPEGSGSNSCSNCTYKLDAAGNLTAFPPAPFALAGIDKHSLIAVDPASGLHLIFTGGRHPTNPNEFWTFDITNGNWEKQNAAGVPIFSVWQTTVASLSNYGVLMFPKYESGGSTVWLYKHGQQVRPNPPTDLNIND
jgi:hypothetical protein